MDNLRLFLFAGLAAVLFLMWQAWQQDYAPKPSERAPPVSEQKATPTQADLPSAPLSTADERTAGAAPAALPEIGNTFESAHRVKVQTDLLAIEIDTLGGDLRQVDLLSYPVSLQEPDQPFRLLDDTDTKVFVAQSGLLSRTDAPTHFSTFEAEKDRYVLPDGADTLEVPLTWTGPDGTKVTKVYTFRRNSYLVEVKHIIENNAAAPWTGRMYGQLQRNEPASGGMRFVYTYTGGVLHTAEEKYDKVDFEDMHSSPVARTGTGGWAAMIQHYFAAAWIPDQQDSNLYHAKSKEGGLYAVDVVTPLVTVPEGATGELKLKIYVGPKEQPRLEAAAPGLELAVDYGILTILAQPIFWLLTKIHGVVGNWGWAIIILTILIKLAFFHLSATSYKSMANMRRLQPRLMALKERYGDDRAKLNQAMMELYKKEKINPLGGCLPIVVQIPVFIALYWVLLESVELRQAPFMFWIHDLATHDPFFVLPLLMGASMVIQQRLNPAPMDPIQQKVMMVLPIVFTVFFLFFPSGLVLYWFVNNTLSIAQQWVITRRIAPGT